MTSTKVVSIDAEGLTVEKEDGTKEVLKADTKRYISILKVSQRSKKTRLFSLLRNLWK